MAKWMNTTLLSLKKVYSFETVSETEFIIKYSIDGKGSYDRTIESKNIVDLYDCNFSNEKKKVFFKTLNYIINNA